MQNAPRWPLFVNRLLRQGLHLILTGSNANLLSDELITHLTGRYNEIRLFPFSFEEFCRIKNVDMHGQHTKAIGLRGHALNEYLKEGGFPETLDGTLDKTAYTKTLLDTIIKKDICKRLFHSYGSLTVTIQVFTTGRWAPSEARFRSW